MTMITARPPGQSETTSSGITTSYTLIMRQTWGMVYLGTVVLAILTFLVCAFAIWDRGLAPWWAWMQAWGIWLIVPFCVWPVACCALGVWRFAAEIADPSYPTPRSASNPEWQREGPHWPWTRETLVEIPEPKAPNPAEPQPTLRVELVNPANGSGNKLQVMEIPLPSGGKEQLARYAHAILHQRAVFSEEGGRLPGATSFGYTQMVYREQLKPTLKEKHYIHDGGKAGVRWLGPGLCFLVSMVLDEYGIDGVPQEYYGYLPASVRPSVRASVAHARGATDGDRNGLVG